MFVKGIFVAAVMALTPITSQVAAQEFGPLERWETDFSKTVIDINEVVDVIAADQIPSNDNPQFKPASEETSIPGNEPVVALNINGVARAYPLRYLMWHEIVNDTIGGVPVAVTYCPLCNTSLVFERTLDGEPVTFGTTGKLRFSNLLMYDRKEQNWWQQYSGEAVVGTRAGERLRAIPSFLISFDLFLERFPDGDVLLADGRRARLSGTNPYVNYDTTPLPFLFRGDLPEDIEPMMRIAFVDADLEEGLDDSIAVTLPYLEKNAPFRVGPLEFRWSAGQASALDQRQISASRDVGNIEVYRMDKEEPELVVYMVTFAFMARAYKTDLEIVQLEN
ncbi:MAG: DUF3179 domain-containing protein [Devosiaceae bacterium]|nr:DUF3179 domain-containing protein [Devosiaceae bacterium]